MPPAALMFRDRLDSAMRRGMVLVFGAVPLVAGGCQRAADVRPGDIRHYTVAKGAEPTLSVAGPAAGTTAGISDATPLRYEVPEGWTDGGASGMRLATLLIGGSEGMREVTVIPASGTLESNVARWQKQLDPDADAAALEATTAAAIAAAETLDVAGATATVVLLRGGADDAEAILGAMLPVENAAALFVKFRGAADIALRERERFNRFVSSIRWKK